MKKFLVIFCALLLVLGVAGAASAIPYTDIYDAGHLYMTPNSSVSWTFNIIDDGFNPATQDVTSASVELSFSDDSKGRWFGDWFEVAVLDFGENLFIWEVDSGDISFAASSVITLSEYGEVDATLTCLIGDYYFKTAELFAEGTELIPTAHASEPASMFMFGTGLIGVALIARKKFGKV